MRWVARTHGHRSELLGVWTIQPTGPPRFLLIQIREGMSDDG
ncbi:MAG TPA: hypothetical protein VH209_09795 [Steroidobacteraceae bacterium]|nr:hypothetical protein [Steroidobacteraceae bacterium]